MSYPNQYAHLVPGDFINTDDIFSRGTESTRGLTRQIIESVGADDIVCVSGCGFGHLVCELIDWMVWRRKPSCRLYAFDTFGEDHSHSEFWEGHPIYTPWGERFDQWAARIGGPTRMIDHFKFYLNNCPSREFLTDWAQFPWWTVAEEFKDNSVSWVIANGAHRPLGIRRELDKWWPKMKSGGKIGLYGHDSGDFGTKLEVARQFFSDMKAKNLEVTANSVILER